MVEQVKRTQGIQKMNGRMTVITGGANGIGLAVAEECLARGGKVALLDINETNHIERLTSEFGEDRVLFVQSDVTKANDDGLRTLASMDSVKDVLEEPAFKDAPLSMEAAMKQAAEWNGGKIDYLVSNAGIQIQKPFEKQEIADFQKLLGINLFGKINAAHAAVPYMGKGGHIINTSSVHGHVGSDERTPYCTAMHGTIGFTKSLALDMAAKGVKVNSVSPAFIDTALARTPLQNLIDSGRFANMDDAVEWRLQYQRGGWVQMDDVVNTYCDILDGTRALAPGEDVHDDAMTLGYVDAAVEKGGAIFEKAAEVAVDALTPSQKGRGA